MCVFSTRLWKSSSVVYIALDCMDRNCIWLYLVLYKYTLYLCTEDCNLLQTTIESETLVPLSRTRRPLDTSPAQCGLSALGHEQGPTANALSHRQSATRAPTGTAIPASYWLSPVESAEQGQQSHRSGLVNAKHRPVPPDV